MRKTGPLRGAVLRLTLPALAITGLFGAIGSVTAQAHEVAPVAWHVNALPADCVPSATQACGPTDDEKKDALSDRSSAKGERNSADSKIAQREKDATKCQPKAVSLGGQDNTNCLTATVGDPSAFLGPANAQRTSMNSSRTNIEAFRGQPMENATAVANDSCNEFGRDLPRVKKAADLNIYTTLCKEMTR
ncbi:hypothetical protein ACODT3_40740 [Streptomyces sp. 4.24]|uniref:hypothetical protein n=1 Tax=Streptomyces tritrimontium TaxID=3406573 RepID=UPI003BB582B3